jgi:hypothetical protein
MPRPDFSDRTYHIIPSGSVQFLDFNDIMQTSPDTLRYSVDGTKAIIKYIGDEPSSVGGIPGRGPAYTWEQMISIVSGLEWSSTGII